MRRLAFVLIAFLAGPVWATDADMPEDTLILDGTTAVLEDFHWLKRPLAVFADSPQDPNFIRQMELIDDLAFELEDRDVVVLVDTDPDLKSELRRELRPRGFAIVLLDKEGRRYLRKPSPWSVREISASIDKMPLRQQEIRERR